MSGLLPDEPAAAGVAGVADVAGAVSGGVATPAAVLLVLDNAEDAAEGREVQEFLYCVAV